MLIKMMIKQDPKPSSKLKRLTRAFLKATAVTASLSMTSALLLPFTEKATGTVAKVLKAKENYLSKRAARIEEDGTLFLNGFKGTACDVNFTTRHSVYSGEKTALIHMHGSNYGKAYFLSSDQHASAYLSRWEASKILTTFNPEIIIMAACNGDAAFPEDVAQLVECPDKRLKTIIMVEPGYLFCRKGSEGKFDFHSWAFGRTIYGDSSHWGIIAYTSDKIVSYLNDRPSSAGFIRYEKTEFGTWQSHGAYKADNRYNLIDITPVGWALDVYNLAARGPNIVNDELIKINNPQNNLSYWEKVERNLAKPVASIVQLGENLARPAP
jgi:hypothetical protein